MSLTSLVSIPQPNLAWDFNQTTTSYIGDVAPIITNGNPTYNANGKFRQSIVFNNSPGTGTNSLYYGTLPSNPTSYTISAWVKPLTLPSSGTNNDQDWFSWDAGPGAGTYRYWYVYTGYGQSWFSVTNNQRGTGNLAPTGWSQGTWGHITVVMQALSPSYVYFNGNLVSTISADTTNTFPLTTLSLAKTPAGPGTALGANCELDDFRIYNTALSDAQVQSIYQAQGMQSRGVSTSYRPTVTGYSYVPWYVLPSSFTLTQTSTGNAWTYNSGSNELRDGNWGADPSLTLSASQPNDIYSARNPGMWYRLFGSGNYVRHGGFNMRLNSYGANNFDYAWAFFLKNGTNNQVKIWNPYPGDGVGYWVQSGIFTAGRISINTSNPEQAHIYTISSPIIGRPTTLNGPSLFNQLSQSARSSAMGAFSLKAVNGTTARAVNVAPGGAFPIPGFSTAATQITNQYTQTLTGYPFTGSYVANCSTFYSGSGTEQPWRCFDKNNNGTWWTTSGASYSPSTGLYSAGVYSTTISDSAYSGEWIQIKLPVSVTLLSYTIYNASSWNNRAPVDFKIAGSNDGTTWTLVDTQTAITSWLSSTTNLTFTPGNQTTAYSYYRLCVNKMGTPSGFLSIGELVLNGTVPSLAQDFYADRLGNLLTAPVTGQSLANWLGGATGYVTTWYDQSGNGNHMSCSSIGIQPKIDLTNAWIDFKTSAYFDTSANPASGPVPYSNTMNYTVICHHNTIGNNGGGICGCSNAAPNINTLNNTNNFRRIGSNYRNYWYGNDQTGGTYVTGNKVTFKWDGTYRYIYGNGTLQTVPLTASSNWWQTSSSGQLIGRTTADATNYTINGEMYSIFMFTTALSDSDRTRVEDFS